MYTTKHQSSVRLWMPEIIALAATILALAGLVIILLAYDGKPIFSWNGVSLNTVVSILSTTSKAALMLAVGESIGQWKWILFLNNKRKLLDFDKIDQASHGPLGSLKLFWKSKKTMFLRIGALTTLLAIAIDPFTQQLVQLEQKLAYSADSQTVITRADRYSKGTENRIQVIYMESNGTTAGSYPIVSADADFSMQSAFMYGLTQPLDSVIQQLSFQCPTGNCSWPVFESLAVCSVCNDVGSKLARLPGYGAMYSLLDKTNGGLQLVANQTRFGLPNGLQMENPTGFRYSGNGDNGDGVLMVTFGTSNASLTNSLQQIDTLILAMSILRMRPDPNNSSAAWPAAPLEASECGLYYCVKRYNSRVESGALKEIEEIMSNATRSSNSWKIVSPYSEDELNEDTDPAMVNSIAFNGISSYFSRTDLMLGRSFNISQESVDSISSYVKTQLTYAITNDTTVAYDRTANESTGGMGMNGYYLDSPPQYRPSSMSALLASPDINATFQSLARSMSNAIRASGDGSHTVTGQAGTVITHYKIIWPWISLHCVIVVLGFIFLCHTMRKSSNASVPVWKTSALATLSRGSRVVHLLDNVNTVSQMEERASKEDVQLLTREEAVKDNCTIPSEYVEGVTENPGSEQSSTLLLTQHAL